MGGVTVKVKGKTPRVDVRALADVISPLVVGHIIERNYSGRDRNDKSFKGYSTGYKRLLLAEGESTTVDHHRTNRLHSSVRETARVFTGTDTVRITWGVSPSMVVIAARLQSLRLWFGVSPRGKRAVDRAVERAKQKALKQLR